MAEPVVVIPKPRRKSWDYWINGAVAAASLALLDPNVFAALRAVVPERFWPLILLAASLANIGRRGHQFAPIEGTPGETKAREQSQAFEIPRRQ